MDGASLGHQLFERWLISTYGESTRSPGRPHFKGLRETQRLIKAELKRREAELREHATPTRLPPPRQAIGLYHWLATASSGRTTPRPYIRAAIETITNGAVPRSAWECPRRTLDEMPTEMGAA